MSNLSPPPSRDPDVTGYAWQKWFSSIQALLNPVASGGAILWSSISKLGSSLTDLATRNHSDLHNINTAAYTHLSSVNAGLLTGGTDTALHFHSSDRSLANASGTLLSAQFPALIGDVTTTAGSLATLLSTVNGTVGTFGNSTNSVTATVDGKGRITSISNSVIAFPVVSFNTRTGAITLLAADVNSAIVGSLLNIPQFTTAGAPAYVKGSVYFDTTLNKLRVGGATAWETVTSV